MGRGEKLFFFLNMVFIYVIMGLFQGVVSVLFHFLATQYVWDFSSLTRDGNCTHCIGSKECEPLDHWGSPME